MPTPNPVAWLTEQLSNCADIMPREACADLDLPVGTTYAEAVQVIAAV